MTVSDWRRRWWIIIAVKRLHNIKKEQGFEGAVVKTKRSDMVHGHHGLEKIPSQFRRVSFSRKQEKESRLEMLHLRSKQPACFFFLLHIGCPDGGVLKLFRQHGHPPLDRICMSWMYVRCVLLCGLILLVCMCVLIRWWRRLTWFLKCWMPAIPWAVVRSPWRVLCCPSRGRSLSWFLTRWRGEEAVHRVRYGSDDCWRPISSCFFFLSRNLLFCLFDLYFFRIYMLLVLVSDDQIVLSVPSFIYLF